MNCSRCGQENPPQAKFCIECAAPLARSCGKCGTPLPPTAKFCPECAHPTASPAPVQARFASPEAYTPKHLAEKILTSKSALEGERKQVTVLFADLKGSMELLADSDPEEARALLDPVLAHMMEAVHRLESGSVSYGKATAYLPLIELLRGYFQIEARDEGRKIREKVTGKVLSLDRALEPSLPAYLTLLDVPPEDPSWERLDPPQRRQRTLDGIKRLLLRESQVQPLVVMFEDLHWIDTETQALLDSLVESLPTARLLLLVNYRPEYSHGWGGPSPSNALFPRPTRGRYTWRMFSLGSLEVPA